VVAPRGERSPVARVSGPVVRSDGAEVGPARPVPPMPIDEPRRQLRLWGTRLLDTPEEPDFDRLVALAAMVCDAPIALVSLVDGDRQWFKARCGTDLTETPRADSFCAWAIASGEEVFVVEDATADFRFAENPLVVGPPWIRFYAGAPLHDGAGSPIGTICVLDREARSLDPTAQEALRLLAAEVIQQITRRVELRAAEAEIHRRQELEQRLAEAALGDPLTGLPNRTWALRQAERALAERGPDTTLAVLLLDLDRFKLVNDTFGHHAGDQLLRRVAAELRNGLRANDLVARLGGDEFLVLVEEVTTLEEACAVAERAVATVAAVETGPGALPLRASVGVTLAGGDATVEALLAEADMAMYAVKARGGGVQVFTPELRRQRARRVAIESLLGVAEARGELTVVFQPIVRAATGEVRAVEVLLRWQSDELGTVSPEEFIPVAEETGLIMAIGRFVLNQGLAVMRECDKRFGVGAVPRLSVNLSARQLLADGLVEEVRDLVRPSGLTPDRLVFEVTEGVLLDEPEKAATVLAALRGAGTLVALDDFGTGYSSLTYLANLPVDVVKVDRSFTLRAHESRGATVLRAVTAMTSALGLASVAEGIEAPEDLVRVRELGFTLVQGYLVGRPMAASALFEWVAAHRAGQSQRSGTDRSAPESHPALTVARHPAAS